MAIDRPRIDRWEFISLSRIDDSRGGPLIVREQCQPINRLGVDGTAILLTGKRAEPFQMRSLVDIASLAILPLAVRTYTDLIGQAVEVHWQGIDFAADHETKYVVLDVVPSKSGRLLAHSGGLVSGSTAYLELLWTLQPVVA